jgi:hypothetical protein
MARDESPEIGEFSRRAMLRNGLLVGLGTATIVSASLAGGARAYASLATASAPAANAPEQWNWAYCHNCRGMWYPGNGGDKCPYTADMGGHVSSPSDNYGFYYNATGTDWQEDWLWCHYCSGMFWASNDMSAGVCPGLGSMGSHDGSGSFHYVAYRGSESGTGQPGWSWCSQCSGMWWSNGAQTGGSCPAEDFGNGPHTSAGSSKYLIPHH